MSDFTSRLFDAIGKLLIAMLNATLILVVLCLVLGLRLTDRVDSITSNFAQNLITVEPLRAEVQAMTTEISGLRADLAAVRENTGELTSETAQALATRIETFEERIGAMDARMDTVRERARSIEIDPEAILDYAIETAAVETVNAIGQLAGCTVPAVTALEPLVPAAPEAGSN